ncbi:MAG: FAD-dependent oxidoreductase [Rhodobacteraceae bacterium]|nr:FAD-dependent oxidoreductase [Paracoccaceae bacterium]
MSKPARVVVIGGGIAGCSTLYHLVREGWSDVLLLERDEITSGTTWHSAAQVTSFGTNQTMVGLKSHSINLYQRLAESDEHPVHYNYGDGGIRLGGTIEQMDGYRHFSSMARGMGVQLEVIDAGECARRHPLISTSGLLGGLWDPHDGHIDPSQLCHALLHHARSQGARIERDCPALDIRRKPGSDHWLIETPGGGVECEKLVIAAGYRCNEVAAMIGVRLPVISMEHQYLITGPMPEVQASPNRIPLIRCPIDDFYMRQEQSGLLVGFYEQDCRAWGIDGIDPGFTQSLCADDLERISPIFERAIARIPALERVGIRNVVNGPITYSADGLPLVGKIPGRHNAYCIAGLRAGIGEGGGLGWLLAQIITRGEACLDTWCLDPCRFGQHVDEDYTIAKAVEDYRNEFRFHLPDERRPAGMDARTTGLTGTHRQMGGFLHPVNGWERVAYYRSSDTPGPSYRRSPMHDLVGEEVLHLHRHVGISEISGFNRIAITGSGAREWLQWISPGDIPGRSGQVRLCYLLNHHGNFKCEAVIVNLGDDGFWYLSAAAAEVHDFDWLSAHLPSGDRVQLQPLTEDYQAILLAGPDSRKVLTTLFGQVCSAANLPFLHAVRTGGPDHALIINLSYSGELAFEVHLPSHRLRHAWEAIMSEGTRFHIKPFGSHAVDSMRLEKGLGHWKSEWITETNPLECGLERFITADRNTIGRDALAEMSANGPRRQLCLLNIDTGRGCAFPGATINCAGQTAGTVTSGHFGYRTDTNLALGFIDSAHLRQTSQLSVDILGTAYPASILDVPPFDPAWSRVRASSGQGIGG